MYRKSIATECRRPRHSRGRNRRSQDQLPKTLDTKTRSTRPRLQSRPSNIEPTTFYQREVTLTCDSACRAPGALRWQHTLCLSSCSYHYDLLASLTWSSDSKPRKYSWLVDYFVSNWRRAIGYRTLCARPWVTAWRRKFTPTIIRKSSLGCLCRRKID